MDNKNTENTKTTPETPRKKKEKKIRNKAKLGRGAYSLVITAAVLAVLILFNLLVSVVAKKVDLEFDMTGSKANSISADNEKYLKTVKDDVTVIVCGERSEYTNYLMQYSTSLYRTTGDETYFKQTLSFLEKYQNINSKIKVEFIDMQSAEFTKISQQYSTIELAFGDLLVTCQKSKDNTRVKHIKFNDIYTVYDPSGFAAYGYDNYAIGANKLETALTGAISYVTSEKTYKVALLNGHATHDYTSAYKKLLEANNYSVTVVSDKIVSNISEDYDAAAILAPATDFISSETEALSKFLDNGGKGGKGLVFFADATNPALPNLYEFLSEWGIYVEEGVLMETNADSMPNKEQKTALVSLPTGNSKLTENMNGFITGFNVPMLSGEASSADITVTKVASTLETAVKAPVGAADDWKPGEEDYAVYDTVITAEKKYSDSAKSCVYAFSSIEFISSDWAENSSIANKDAVLAITEKASGVEDSGITFVAKSVTSESFQSSVTTGATGRVQILFMWILPLCVLIAGFAVYFIRRSAE